MNEWLWTVGWLAWCGFAHLTGWRVAWAFVTWPYWIGDHVARWGFR
jgi:hypothetical protein